MCTIILCYTAEVLCIWLLHTLEVAHVITVCVTNYWTLNSCNLNSMLVVSGWLILSGCLILSGWHVHFEPFLSPEKTWKWGQLTQRLLWQQVGQMCGVTLGSIWAFQKFTVRYRTDSIMAFQYSHVCGWLNGAAVWLINKHSEPNTCGFCGLWIML